MPYTPERSMQAVVSQKPQNNYPGMRHARITQLNEAYSGKPPNLVGPVFFQGSDTADFCFRDEPDPQIGEGPSHTLSRSRKLDVGKLAFVNSAPYRQIARGHQVQDIHMKRRS